MSKFKLRGDCDHQDWKTDLYIQDIKCEKCGRIIGYAPYHRDAYQCLECHAKIQHEFAKTCIHDWSWGPADDIDTCYDCLSTRKHVPMAGEEE